MARLPKLKHVKFVRSKDKLYAYFNTGQKVAGKTVWSALPPPSSVGFYDSYAAMLGARTKRAVQPRTVENCAEAFQRSEDFTKLARGTQRLYTVTLKRIVEQLGKFPLDGVERKHIHEVVTNRLKGNGARNIFLAVVGVLYAFGRRNDWTDREPTKDIKPFKTGEHEPWPEDVLQAGLRAEHDRTRLAVNLLYFTGQRVGDVLALRWDDIHDGAVFLTQQKTGKPLRIPLHSSLKAELAKTERKGETIITNWQGGSMRADVIRREFKTFGEQFGVTLVPHGLRKNAVNALLEAGATVAQVAAITGQSFGVVEHYARRVSQILLSEEAIGLFENSTAKAGFVRRRETVK